MEGPKREPKKGRFCLLSHLPDPDGPDLGLFKPETRPAGAEVGLQLAPSWMGWKLAVVQAMRDGGG